MAIILYIVFGLLGIAVALFLLMAGGFFLGAAVNSWDRFKARVKRKWQR